MTKKLLHRWLVGCAGCLVASGAVLAQQGANPTSYYYEPAPADELGAIKQRMAQYEAELRDLRSQVGQSDMHLTATATELADEKKEEKGDGPLKKSDIVTKVTYKITGRAFFDQMMSSQDDLNRATFGNASDRTRFDTIRLGVEGDLYENIFYKMEFAIGEQNSTTDEPVAKDIFLELRNMAILQNVRVGHYKEPFSLEELTSSRFLTFMERSLLNGFTPARNGGIMEFGHVFDDETLSWYTGLFRSEMPDSPPTSPPPGTFYDLADWAWTSRVAWNPFYDEPTDGRYLTHVAAAYSYRNIGDRNFNVSKDYELNLQFPVGNPLRSAAAMTSDFVQLFNVELATVRGPLHAEAEWTHVRNDGVVATDDLDWNAFYLQAGYFLTGEHKGYKKSTHAFDRTKILEPFFAVRTADGVCRGWGAWEVKARYSYFDGNDGPVNRHLGRVQDFSTGLNWYLCDNASVMFDYIHGISDGAPGVAVSGGDIDEFGIRVRYDW